MTAPDGMAQLVTEALFNGSTWTDISQWRQSAVITRDSTREQGPVITYEGGTSVSALDNSDARFTPENLAGPYVDASGTQVRPMIPLRHTATWNSVSYALWRGFTQSWDPGDDLGPDYAVTTLTAADGFLVLEGTELPAIAAAGASELSGARADRILTDAGWYDAGGTAVLSAGESAVQATTEGATALSLLQLTAASEIGAVYVDEQGQLVFAGRHDLLTAARSSVVQAVFGDRPGTVVPGVCTSPALNASPGFADGTTGWTADHGATIARATTYQYGPLPGVLSVHGDGVTAAPRALCAGIPVTAGQQYTAFAVTYTPAAAGMRVQVDWRNISGTFISSSVSATVTTADPWQVLSVTATAPATAVSATLIPAFTGTPAAGVIAYVGYASLISGPASAAAAELYYPSVARVASDLTIANDIQATRDGGALQQSVDIFSVDRYGFKRSYARSDLILTDDAETLSWAQYVRYITSAGNPEFDSITLLPSADPDNLWPLALGLKIGDRIQVWRRPPGMTASPITRDCFIRGITHVIGAGEWTVTFSLQDATRYAFLVLDDPIRGRFDHNAFGF